MDIIKKIKSQSINRPVYHYTSQTGLLGIISKKSIWATAINYLNDTLEFEYAMKLIKEELKWLSKQIKNGEFGNVEEEINCFKMIHSLFEFSISQQFIKDNFYIFVASFSENGDLLSQWRAYCPENSGFNLGFDLNLVKDVVNKQGFIVSKCLYDPEEQKAAIKYLLREWGLLYFDNMELFSVFAKKGDIKGLTSAVMKVASKLIEAVAHLCPLLKEPSFVEEKEWRIVSHPISVEHPQVKFREGNSMLVPYFNLHLAQDTEGLSLESITIGPTTDPVSSSESLKAFLKSEKVNCEKVNISKIPYRSL